MQIWKKSNLKKLIKKNINHNVFNDKIWQKKILNKIKINKKNLISKYSNFFVSSSPLPMIILGMNKKKIEIIDYGSGDQEILFQLLSYNINKIQINIDSVEVKNIVKILKKEIRNLNRKNININFSEKFNFDKTYDFVHISDSLQYNFEWKSFLKKIAKRKHKFIILNNLTAGSFKTFAAEQKFYNKKLPYFFFNEKEIINIFSNYKAYKYLYLNKINGLFQEYPQSNFDRKDRIKYPKTLIFVKKN